MSETADQTVIPGGSGAPENEAPGESKAGGSATGREGAGTRAAWTSQLSRELRDNPETLKAISGYKTINELVEAFVKNRGASQKQGASAEGGGEGAGEAEDAFGRALSEAAEAAGEAAPHESPAWLDQAAVKETVTKLVGEFGPAAADYYRKALGCNGLGKVLEGAGLKSHPDIGRALVLLGKEMSETYTPAGKPPAGGHAPLTLAEGARLY